MHAASAMQTICNMLYTCILNFKVYINHYLFYFLFIYFLHIPILLSGHTNLRTKESFFDFYDWDDHYSRARDQIQ